MVENSEDNHVLFRDIQSTKAFINSSKLIQKSIQNQVNIKDLPADAVATNPSKQSLGSADQQHPEDDLPRFGAVTGREESASGKFNDPFQAEHDELDNLVGKALSGDAGKQSSN